MMKNYLILFFLFAFAMNCFSQNLYKVKLSKERDVYKLTKDCSIEQKIDDFTFLVYATEDEYEKITRYVKEVEKQIEILPLDEIKMAPSTEIFLQEFDYYPTFPQFVEIMQNFEKNYPYLCSLDTIGYSVRGRPLLVLKISPKIVINKNHNQTEVITNKPNFMYISSMHGNELVGYILMLKLIDYLLKYYATDNEEGARVSKLVDNINIFIMPLMNPDGAYNSSDSTVVGARRNNANGKDLNRNFPCQYTNPENTTVGKEPETIAIMEFTQKNTIHLSANFHTGAVVVNYPYDAMPDGSSKSGINNCPDSIWFKEVSLVYALKNPDFANSTQFKNGITLGTAWYPIYGGMQDWKYVYAKGREVTIELSSSGIPAASTLPTFWEKNKESLLSYMEQALYGLKGKVTDENGNPIQAKIRLLEIPETEVYSDKNTGFFHRFTSTGFYNIEISADGFITDTIRNVFVKFDSTSYINSILKKEINYCDNTEIYLNAKVYPNPCDDYLYLDLQKVNKSNLNIKILNLLGETIYSKDYESISMNENLRINIDTKSIPNGIYFLTIYQSDKNYTFPFIKNN